MRTFTFKPFHVHCEAALAVASEQNDIATVSDVSYNHDTNVVTVQVNDHITMADADKLADQLVVHAPLTRNVFDNNNRVTNYLWCSIGSSDHAVVDTTSGETYWCGTPEQIAHYLSDQGVDCDFEQFE